MTDRLNGFVVVLEQDMREDDAQATLAAIRQIRGVLSVEPNVRDINAIINSSRMKRELLTTLIELVQKS